MNTNNEHLISILNRIPHEPGVYQYFNSDGEIIYVGKAKDLHRRVNSYFQKEHEWNKTRQLVKNISDIKYIVVPNEQDAFLLENNLIKQYQPHYNILLKDGKSYPSICITKEEYPRIFKTRKRIKNAGTYYGPYSYGNTVDLVLEIIHKLFPLRTCNTPIQQQNIDKQKYKVCLKYHLGTCCGICEQKITKAKYDEYIDQSKKIIRGDAHILVRQLREEMITESEKMRFEKAQEIKEKIDLIEKFCSKTIIVNDTKNDFDVYGYTEEGNQIYVSVLSIHNGSIVKGQTVTFMRQDEETKEEILAQAIAYLRNEINSENKEIIVPFIPDYTEENIHINIATSREKKQLLALAMHNVQQYKDDCLKQSDKLNPEQRSMRILTKLKDLLGLPETPVLIESFDNSNIQGSDAVAGCVVFRKGKKSKADYRKYQIKSVEGPDDYASMREIVKRHYSKYIEENKVLPNLIIADGGEGQMNAIKEVLHHQLGLSIPVAGLKKDDKHRTNVLLYGEPIQEIGLKVTDELFRFLVEIQDEVHRFAISYHKNKRSKTQTKSELDDIQGVGEITKQKILNYFHSVKRAKSASREEWEKVVGKSLGSRLYEHFSQQISL